MAREVVPICPRCGYDQSGIVASWERASPPACPLRGVCTECGLGFDWVDILNPRFRVARWSFEHAWGRVPVGELARTWARAVLPWRLWHPRHGLRLEQPVVFGRLAAYALLAVAMAHLVIASSSAWSAYHEASTTRSWLQAMTASRPAGAYPPIAFPSPLGEAFVAMAWPYGLRWQRSWDSGPNVSLLVHLEASSLLLVASATLALVTPLSFLILGDTMRRARARRRHLVRAFVYSLSPFPAIILVHALLATPPARDAIAAWIEPIANYSLGIWQVQGWLIKLGEAMGLVYGAWLAVFWWLVPARYLRLDQAWAVALAMLTIGALTALVGATCVAAAGAW